MDRTSLRRAIPKPVAVLLALMLALYAAPLLASPAAAAASDFEVDGNLADDPGGGVDWQTLRDTHAAGLQIQNDNGTAIGDATVFATSSKENDVVAGENTPAQWQQGSPNTAPPKTDVGNVYKYVRTDSAGHIELFFAWDRLSPSGTDYYYLELNKLPNTTTGAAGTADYYSVPNRSVDDVRFTLHELGNGDLVLLGIDKWDGTKWVSQTIEPGNFVGEVNDANIDPAGFDSPAIAKNGPDEGTIPKDQFFETYFDLSDLIDLSAGCPPALGTLNFRTATGESAEETGDNLKDYIEPIPLDAPSTCGEIVIHKVWTGADAPASLTVHLDCSDNALDQDVVLTGPGWTHTVGNVPGGTTCQVTEPNVPTGWALASISPSGQFTVGSNQSVAVTVTDATGRIRVVKNISGAPNGASTSFTFDVNCPGTAYDQTLTINVGGGTSGSTTTGLIPAGTSCTVTERSAPDWKVTSVVPTGGAVTVPGTVTFTNTRLQGALNISKAVSPVAGNGVVVEFGDTLTYTLTVSATGEATQHNVVVSDYVPGYDPARPTSGKTTYVASSAACVGAGTCTVTQPGADHKISWALGDMAAGTTRQVTFKVTIDDVPDGAPGETVAVDILNAGAVKSTETPLKPSNQVITPVTKVLPIKVAKPPKVLPHTGAGLPLGPLATAAVSLVALGLLLVAATRRRAGGAHRR